MIPLDLMALGLTLAPPCIPVSGDRIEVRHVQPFLPEWSSVESGALLEWAPAPGKRRVLSPRDLARWAHLHGAATPALSTGLCFEWPMIQLSSVDILSAIQRALGQPGVAIEIVDWSRKPLPKGVLSFNKSQCAGGNSASMLCYGAVEYAPHHRQPVWARVALRTHIVQVEVTGALAHGTLIKREDLRVVETEGPRQAIVGLRDPDAIVGRRCRRNLAPGQPIHESDLEVQPLAEKGDLLMLEIRSGSARLKLPAYAEARGVRGDIIPVRNPDTGRVLRARLEEKGKAVLAIGAGGDR